MTPESRRLSAERVVKALEGHMGFWAVRPAAEYVRARGGAVPAEREPGAEG